MLWLSSLETGIPSIDEQHKELFRQLDILMDKNNKHRYEESLHFLEKYIIKHFTDEQKLHMESHYPKAIIHKTYHDNYILHFKKLKEDYYKDPEDIMTMLYITKNVVDWLNNHILVHDMEFSKFYKSI